MARLGARFTVSRPMPRLAPMTRTVAIAPQADSAFLILSALAASTSGFSILLRGRERYPLRARHDVEMQVEHHLPAGRLVELLQGDGRRRRTPSWRSTATFCTVFMQAAS